MSALPRKIAITSGDPSGVGPELIELILRQHEDLWERLTVIGADSWIQSVYDQFGVEGIGVVHAEDIDVGIPSVQSAKVALSAMEIAAKGCFDGRFSAVVTGPISKEWCQKAGMRHPGQTEFFAEKWDGEPTMAFVADNMRVSLVTWHVPLMKVWENLSEHAVTRAICDLKTLLNKLGYEKPRIAVCGFNPHAGENGVIGREEIDVLNPMLDRLKRKDVELSGCHPSDTVFFRHMDGEFDGVVALYHDQALAPLKTVAFHNAVNVTLGLPYIRTSPDHGTAFQIAGKHEAKPDSFLSAIKLALQLI